MRASPDLEWRIIIIDVVSELMRASPDPAVDHGADILFLTAVSEGELLTGAASLPAGQCRDRLVGAICVRTVSAFRRRPAIDSGELNWSALLLQ